jgi:hypothetical protein
MRQRVAQRRQFADYAGRYKTFTTEDVPIGDEYISVKWLGGNLLFAESEGKEGGTWESFITLDNAMPHVGNGFFQYKDRVDYGVHQIQRSL